MDPTPIVIRKEQLPPEGDLRGPPETATVEPLARLALVLGIASILAAGVAVGPVAVACGLVARARLRRQGGRGATVALVGIWTGVTGLVLWTGLLLVFLHLGAAGDRDGATNVFAPRAGRLDPASIAAAPAPVRQVLGAHVSLQVVDAEERDRGAGSGIALGRQNGSWYVLTCRHLLGSGADTSALVRARWVAGDTASGRAVWLSAPALDLAVVELVGGAGLPEVAPPQLAGKGELHVGDGVMAVGDPVSFGASFVQGIVSAIRLLERDGMQMRIIQAQIPLNPGNSGGGLYDTQGRLVGSWSLPKVLAEGMGFSISVENLWDHLQEMPEPVAKLLWRLRTGSDAGPAVAPTRPDTGGAG